MAHPRLPSIAAGSSGIRRRRRLVFKTTLINFVSICAIFVSQRFCI
jgi:hypothetical protein